MAVPKKIAEAPELWEWLWFYFTAFLELCSCRSTGFGEGPIPWTAMNAYAIRYQIVDEEEFDLFMRLLTALDMAYLKYRNTKREEKIGPKTKAPIGQKVVKSKR